MFGKRVCWLTNLILCMYFCKKKMLNRVVFDVALSSSKSL